MSQYEISPDKLASLLPLYRRWETEGRPPHNQSFYQKDQKPQHYYDPYHDSIRANDNGTYRFNIQTFDSAEGDTWVSGTFREEDGRITIIEQKSYSN